MAAINTIQLIHLFDKRAHQVSGVRKLTRSDKLS